MKRLHELLCQKTGKILPRFPHQDAEMLTFQGVRSIIMLNQYVEYFERLDEASKKTICEEMVKYLADFSEQDLRTVMPEHHKSAIKAVRKAKRKRRPR